MERELFKQLKEANDAYHNGEPIMTDDAFDVLVATWETQSGCKWTDVVGVGATSTQGNVRPLPMWMGSMNKVKVESNLRTWVSKFKPKRVVISDKLDGISCLFHWVPSNQTYAVYTRGNGRQGTDITYLTDYVPALMELKRYAKSPDEGPKWFHSDSYEFFIRGELILSRDCWKTEQTTTWKDYKNPRNTVAGLVSRRPGTLAHTKIDFVPFTIDMKSVSTGEWKTMNKTLMFRHLKQLCCSDRIACVFSRTLLSEDVMNQQKLSAILKKRREKSPYEIDGIIVWEDTHAYIPNSSGNPEYAFAFKMLMADSSAETLVADIEWNVSRTGVWKPTVLFEPVSIGGTTIRRATGNNATWLIERNIGVGARILVVRSGDVIPKIESVLSPASSTPMPPEGSWKWDTNHTDILATKGHSVDVAVQATYFVSKIGAKHVSKKTLEKYVETHSAAVACLPFPQLFPLVATNQEWLNVPGVKEKSTDTFIIQIRDAWSSSSNATRLLASGLLPRGIGEKQVRAWSEMILENVVVNRDHLTESQLRMMLEGLDGWGAVRVESLMGSLQTIRKGWSWMSRHSPKTSATNIKVPPKDPTWKTLEARIGDRPFVLFTGFRNSSWQSALEEKGKKIITQLSGKHTKLNTVVITRGEKNSSKVLNAMQKEIPVVRL